MWQYIALHRVRFMRKRFYNREKKNQFEYFIDKMNKCQKKSKQFA